jgi:hypothetical protein
MNKKIKKSDNMITEQEIHQVQKTWGDALIEIGRLRNDRGACEKTAAGVIDALYGYDLGTVLFKPTRAAEYQFRDTKDGALSYFIGGNSKFPEDTGFALQPWIKVKFENSGMILSEKNALAMGNYFFTEAETGAVKKVEYTFGYVKDTEGNLKINLHHSSVPFTPSMQ